MRCSNPNCNVPLTRRPRYTEQVGWVHERGAGGVHALKHRRPTGRVLCNDCGSTLWHIGKLPGKIHEDQLTIV